MQNLKPTVRVATLLFEDIQTSRSKYERKTRVEDTKRSGPAACICICRLVHASWTSLKFLIDSRQNACIWLNLPILFFATHEKICNERERNLRKAYNFALSY